MRFLISLFFTAIVLHAAAQQIKLQPAAMQADLIILHDAWTSLHPGLYRYNTPAQMKSYFEVLQEQAAKPMPETSFYLLIAQLAQKVKCGHTYLNPLNLDSATASRILPHRVIPVFFEVLNQRQLIITHPLAKKSSFHRGDEIVAINGIPARRIMDSLLTVSRSDGDHSLGKKYNNINETPDEAAGLSLFDIYFPLFFKAGDQFTLSVKSFASHHVSDYTVRLLTLKDRIAAYECLYGPAPTGKKSWSYRHINPHTAYMKFGTFAFWNSDFNERKYVDHIFDDLFRHPKIKNIIIDIRNNEGGDNTGDYILSYITNRKLGCDDPDHACYRFLSVPDALLPYLQTWDKSFKAPKNPADFFTNELGLHEKKSNGDNCSYIVPQQKRFKGEVFLLINARNSSAGYEMARNVKVNHLGTLIGETTGGSQQGINGGEFFFLTLPNSKLEIDLPLIFNYHPNKPDQGISPNFRIKTKQRDIVSQADAQLSFALLQTMKR